MGVPAFYRWISEKYPKIVVDVLEQRPMVLDGTVVPMNLNDPNPNSIEFDHLYIDMNGLIHPCSHPEDREAPTTEEEMYVNVMKYVDRLVAAIRPRRLLFLAIDGVAPRAKMNQQRSRRFRSAQEARDRKKVLQETMNEMIDMGYDLPDKEKSSHEWDSNVITPGTEFMTKLSLFLRFYVLDRMNKDPFWQHLKVIVSDASEPGEGEHKIMDFIRSQRQQPDYNPNTHHVLHGLDADLIMLALATHEVRFTILREKVYFGKQDKDRDGGDISDAQKLLNAQSMRNGAIMSCLNPQDEWIYKKPLQALHVHTLREYLANEFSCLNPNHGLGMGGGQVAAHQNYHITMNHQPLLSFPFDLERIIDDFIFMCFFVGNDFLPHLPSLDIRDGALDFLIECYKEMLPSLGDYLTRPGGYINLQPADVLLSKVGEIEDKIFQLKNQKEQQFETKMERRRSERQQFQGHGHQGHGGHQGQQSRGDTTTVTATASIVSTTTTTTGSQNDKNNAAANALRERLSLKRSVSASSTVSVSDVNTTPVDDDNEDATATTTSRAKRVKKEGDATTGWASEEEEELESTIVTPILEKVQEKQRKVLSEEEIQAAKQELKNRLKQKESSKFDEYKRTIVDGVKLHESGWKARYYNEPFKRENIEEGGGLKQMCISYVQGLCWVLQYYYQGVPSWNWYYPFHYAPFASDLVNIDTYGIVDQFEKSKPFRPLEQLLAVLPATSAHALPPECHWLMLESQSPIIDLYRDDIPIDPNGKHLPWLWILLLPFIDERRISKAFGQCKSQLSYESRQRNRFGESVLFIHSNHSLVYEFARSHDLLAPAPETDPELLDNNHASSGSTLTEGLLDMDGEITSTAAADAGSEGDLNENEVIATAIDENPILPFPCSMADSLSGFLGKAPSKWYAGLNQRVPEPPNSSRWGMSMIPTNHVAVFTYKLPTQHSLHESKILSGAIPPESTLNDWDLQIRRPPRLNKSGFNVLDLFYESRPERQQPSYQSLQERTNGYLKHDDRYGTLHGGGYHGNNLAPMNMMVSQQAMYQFQGGQGQGQGQYYQQQQYQQSRYQQGQQQGYNRGGQGQGQYQNQYQQGQGQGQQMQMQGSYGGPGQDPMMMPGQQPQQQRSGFSHSANLQQQSGGGGRGGDYRHRVEPINNSRSSGGGGGGYRPSLLTGSMLNSMSGYRPGSAPQQQPYGGQRGNQHQNSGRDQGMQSQQQSNYQRPGYSHANPNNANAMGAMQGGGAGAGAGAGGASMEALRAQLLKAHESGGGLGSQPPQQYQQQGFHHGQGQGQGRSYGQNNSNHRW